MKRKTFIKDCCYTAMGLPIAVSILSSCGGIYYAAFEEKRNQLKVAKSEFLKEKKDKFSNRSFVLITTDKSQFPICLYVSKEGKYSASLMRCTHRNCELVVGGGIYSCPCHGSEFSMTGELLQGPADKDLLKFNIETDETHIYIDLS